MTTTKIPSDMFVPRDNDLPGVCFNSAYMKPESEYYPVYNAISDAQRDSGLSFNFSYFITLHEARDTIKANGARFEGLSYIGQFPMYRNEKYTFSIQGYVKMDIGGGVVCSIPQKELEDAKNLN